MLVKRAGIFQFVDWRDNGPVNQFNICCLSNLRKLICYPVILNKISSYASSCNRQKLLSLVKILNHCNIFEPSLISPLQKFHHKKAK